jgi:uncharacterized membrane protein required for colicin V production
VESNDFAELTSGKWNGCAGCAAYFDCGSAILPKAQNPCCFAANNRSGTRYNGPNQIAGPCGLSLADVMMFWLDTVILCVLAGGALLGALMGFLWQMFWIVSVSTGLYCTIASHQAATNFVQRYLLENASPATAEGAAYLLVFGLVFLVFLIATLTLHRLVRTSQLQWLNRLLGSAFVALLLASGMGLVFLLLNSLPASRPIVEHSKIAPVLVAGIQSLVSRIPDQYRQSVEERVNETSPPKSRDRAAPAPQLSSGKNPALQIPLAERVIQELTKGE